MKLDAFHYFVLYLCLIMFVFAYRVVHIQESYVEAIALIVSTGRMIWYCAKNVTKKTMQEINDMELAKKAQRRAVRLSKLAFEHKLENIGKEVSNTNDSPTPETITLKRQRGIWYMRFDGYNKKGEWIGDKQRNDADFSKISAKEAQDKIEKAIDNEQVFYASSRYRTYYGKQSKADKNYLEVLFSYYNG